MAAGIAEKSIYASKDALKKAVQHVEAIQIDLGVNMMTGNVLRERVSYEFVNKELQQVIELLAMYKPEHRTPKQCRKLMMLIKMMKFFQENSVPLTDEDAL